jgi:hypothetical protein
MGRVASGFFDALAETRKEALFSAPLDAPHLPEGFRAEDTLAWTALGRYRGRSARPLR